MSSTSTATKPIVTYHAMPNKALRLCRKKPTPTIGRKKTIRPDHIEEHQP
jgi:hypothetical protein